MCVLKYANNMVNYLCAVFRLQTGMRGAYGKPQGTCARVSIGQPIMSLRVRDQHRDAAIEALRRSKFKFPGRQKVSSLPDASEICKLKQVHWMMKRLIHSLRYAGGLFIVWLPCGCQEKVLLEWLKFGKPPFIDLSAGRVSPLETWMLYELLSAA